MSASQKVVDTCYAVADKLHMTVVLSADGKKLSGETTKFVIGLIDLPVPFPMKITNSIIKKDCVVVEVQGPGDLFFILYVPVGSYFNPPYYLLICDKAKLSPNVEFPEGRGTITPEKLKVIYGPSVVHTEDKVGVA